MSFAGMSRDPPSDGPCARTPEGFVALGRALRKATADATAAIPLRPTRVHPLTRRDHDNNVGVHAPQVTYAFEPRADWIDITTVQARRCRVHHGPPLHSRRER